MTKFKVVANVKSYLDELKGYCQNAECINRGKALDLKDLIKIGEFRYCKNCVGIMLLKQNKINER